MLIFYFTAGIQLQQAAIAFALTLLYSVPLMPVKQLAFTRKFGFVKTLLLAFTWMFVTAYLPLSQNGAAFTTLGILLMIKRFLFMLMLCILFDNRDAAVDAVRGLHSLATDLSPTVMRWFIISIFVLLFLLNFLLGQQGITVKQRIALQLGSIATLTVFYLSTTKKRGYFFYYFLVDGMMLLSAILVTVASI